MPNWLRFISLAILILSSGPHESFAVEETESSSLEQLQSQVNELERILEESQARLDLITRLYDMDRYRFPKEIKLFGQSMPLQRRDIWERMDREFLFSVHDVPKVLLWMKRANRYFPMIEERLESRGLPHDLKYVAIVESALRPQARSWAGAVGLWQFISSTGRSYRLRKTAWVDERRDPVESTEAALTYLEDLHEMFDDWFLAVAAYNVGEDRIQKALKWQHVTSYFDLVLPSETERYVFRIAAVKVILSDPKKYGFDLPASELYEPLDIEPLEIHVKRGNLDLISLAHACGMTFRSLMDLNPHFRRSFVPKGKYTVYVPVETQEEASKFVQDWNRRRTQYTASSEQKDRIIHLVKPGETLGGIAKEYGVYVKALKEWNQLKDIDCIHAGQRLVIYK